MINIYHFLMAAFLPFVLLKYIFPKVIYVMCETILVLTRIIDYSESKKNNGTMCLITRLFYLCVFIVAWGIMVVLFVPMQILTYIEVFGGFVDEEILSMRD